MEKMENVRESTQENTEEKIDPDQAKKETIRRMTEEEGWTFEGNLFGGTGEEEGEKKDQRYHVLLKKTENGREMTAEIMLKTPYPKVFDAKGKAKDIP